MHLHSEFSVYIDASESNKVNVTGNLFRSENSDHLFKIEGLIEAHSL